MAVDFNIEMRKKQLESLDQFVTCSRDEVQSILKSLDWSVDGIQEEQRLFVNCPHDDNHKVPAEKIEDHIKKCRVKSAGYDLQEEFISEPVKLSNESNIKIDTNKKIEILCQAVSQNPYFRTAWNGKDPDPLTFSRMCSTFSTDERLVLYNYCVSNTQGPPELPEFNTTNMTKDTGDSSYSKKALKSFERDIKRRSVKYKPIHTNHKNYKEVLKEVIDSYMQEHIDCLENINNRGPHTPERFHTEDSIEAEEHQSNIQEYIERPHSSISKFSNHSAGSHDTKSSRHFQSEEYYHNKDHYSKYSDLRSKSRYKYTHHDEDSQESNSISKISSIDMDSSCENNENTSRTHSRDSSIHSSYRYTEKSARYKESRRHKSRSDRREYKKRDHSSGSSKHSSRSHKSREERSHKHHSREKSRRHKNH